MARRRKKKGWLDQGLDWVFGPEDEPDGDDRPARRGGWGLSGATGAYRQGYRDGAQDFGGVEGVGGSEVEEAIEDPDTDRGRGSAYDDAWREGYSSGYAEGSEVYEDGFSDGVRFESSVDEEEAFTGEDDPLDEDPLR